MYNWTRCCHESWRDSSFNILQINFKVVPAFNHGVYDRMLSKIALYLSQLL